MLTLYLIRGVPGSGKSSFAKSLVNFGLVRCAKEADTYFYDSNGNYNFDPKLLGVAHAWCIDSVHYELSNGHSVAVSNTSTTEKEVETYKQIASQYGAKFVSIVVENRHDGVNVHGVPEEKIQQMKNRFSIKL